MGKITTEMCREMFEEFDYKLIDEYKGSDIKMKTICPNGHEYCVTRSNFRKGRRCPKCNGIEPIKYEDVKEYIEKHNYILLEKEYINNRTKMHMICPCGHDCYITYSSFKNTGTRCSECSGNKKKTFEELKCIFENEGYTLLEMMEKRMVKVLCPHGHEWTVRYDAFISGQRCPKCGMKFKGEIKICEILDNMKLKYETQKLFEGCKLKRLLPFDIYIPSLNIAIEYDGIEHYKPTTFGGSYTKEQLQERFEKRIICDHIKEVYCKQNNITLIRIPYFEYEKIKEILSQLIK